MSDALNYVLGLLDSANTPEELQDAERLLMQLEAESSARSRYICRTLQDVADFFGASVSTVKGWRSENPPMPGDDDGYDLREIVDWRSANSNSRSNWTNFAARWCHWQTSKNGRRES
jgi:hypothetical protein